MTLRARLALYSSLAWLVVALLCPAIRHPPHVVLGKSHGMVYRPEQPKGEP